MATMKRGANVSLTREIPDLPGVVLGASWDAGAESALANNLVMAVVLCDASSRALSDEHLVFFNQIHSPEMSVTELEQVLGEDQEQVEIDFAKVPAEVARIVAVLYVNDGPAQRRTLGQLRSCAVRVLHPADNRELVRSEDFVPALGAETALTMGEIYRHAGEWKFKVLGQGYSDGMKGLAADYGLSL